MGLTDEEFGILEFLGRNDGYVDYDTLISLGATDEMLDNLVKMANVQIFKDVNSDISNGIRCKTFNSSNYINIKHQDWLEPRGIISARVKVQLDNYNESYNQVLLSKYKGFTFQINNSNKLEMIVSKTSADETYTSPVTNNFINGNTYWLRADWSYANRAVTFPGTSGNYAYTAPSGNFALTNGIDIRAKISLADWTPSTSSAIVAQMGNLSSTMAFEALVETDGKLSFQFTTTGANLTGNKRTSTQSLNFNDGSVNWIRWVFVNDDAIGNHIASFYTSTDGENWTQLGISVTNSGKVTIFPTSSNITVGASGNSGTSHPSNCVIYYLEIQDLNGNTMCLLDPDEPSDTSLSAWSSSVGDSWSLAGTADLLEKSCVEFLYAIDPAFNSIEVDSWNYIECIGKTQHNVVYDQSDLYIGSQGIPVSSTLNGIFYTVELWGEDERRVIYDFSYKSLIDLYNNIIFSDDATLIINGNINYLIQNNIGIISYKYGVTND